MPQKYLFTTTWKIQAPLKDVWNAIYYSEEWPLWWKDFKSVHEIKKGDERKIGSIRAYCLKSPLAYTLNFRLQLTERTDIESLSAKATGDLDGVGYWRFKEQDGITETQCIWHISTNVHWMNMLAFLLRPVFRYNHRLVMRNGAEALARKLNARLVELTST